MQLLKENAVHHGNSLVNYEIPKKYTMRTMEAIKSGQITKAVRSEIINIIALQLFQHCTHPTSEEYTMVYVKLITTYPSLKDTIGNGYVSC